MKKTRMLKKNYEFKHVLTKGKCYSGKYLEIFIIPNRKKTLNYIGIAISSKAGKAVHRNHLKRLIRENYKSFEPILKCGYRIVFLIKKSCDIKNIYFNDVKTDMKKIFIKSNIFEENIWKKL